VRRSYHSNTSFLDLLFNTLLVFAALFIISFLLISPPKKEGTVEPKAEFLIVMTWPNTIDDDVDVYVEDPNEGIVFFKQQEVKLMHLDRDDVGLRGDGIMTPDGLVQFTDNREVVTLRGYTAGEYTVNIHMYSKKSKHPTPVKIEIVKINPYSIVSVTHWSLTRKGQEETACRFTVSTDGDVISTSDLKKSLVSTITRREFY
tara:strand:- start:1155 stop:1760 length:606 start_codon:yes stop_codon:yes gene_type:complete